MEKENSKEYQYLDHAYRAVYYECGRSNTSLSDEDKKLYKETLKYLDTLMEKIDADGKCEGEGFDDDYVCHNAIPSTKEQRDTLIKAMTDKGYVFDFEKKELRKIEQSNEESNEGNLDIYGLYCAKEILEKTLGKVEGYQTDDGILEHKSAINAVTKLCKKDYNWSEEDEYQINTILHGLDLKRELYKKEGKRNNYDGYGDDI